jgi:hypothetical protein
MIGASLIRKHLENFMSPEFRLLQQAIEDGHNIAATYRGHDRLMTPHTLGWKRNREQCLLYQYGGSSSSQTRFRENSPNNWRCLRVDRLSNLKIVSGDLQTCSQHTQLQTCVDDVLCQLSLQQAPNSQTKIANRLEE